MTGLFLDMQDPDNPMNECIIADSTELRGLLAALRNRPPFLAKLTVENGFQLVFGVGPLGCVQLRTADGNPTYLVTVAFTESHSEKEVVFLCGDTATPMLRRNCLPYDDIVEILATFMDTGKKKDDVLWEEV